MPISPTQNSVFLPHIANKNIQIKVATTVAVPTIAVPVVEFTPVFANIMFE